MKGLVQLLNRRFLLIPPTVCLLLSSLWPLPPKFPRLLPPAGPRPHLHLHLPPHLLRELFSPAALVCFLCLLCLLGDWLMARKGRYLRCRLGERGVTCLWAASLAAAILVIDKDWHRLLSAIPPRLLLSAAVPMMLYWAALLRQTGLSEGRWRVLLLRLASALSLLALLLIPWEHRPVAANAALIGALALDFAAVFLGCRRLREADISPC